MANPPAPPLSIVIANAHPEPALAGHLFELTSQAREVGAEVILAQGHDEPIPSLQAFPEVIRVGIPGASVFRLCALGFQKARGEIVATTEDHCRVGSGWCKAVLAAHRAAPQALLVGGVVENGATSLVGWAHFLVTAAPLLAPLPSGPLTVLPGRANLSYKRSALPAAFPDPGFVEMFFVRQLVAEGAALRQSAEAVVCHDQPVALLTSLVYHFHNGRTIAGARLGWLGPLPRVARLLACPALPGFLALRVVDAVLKKRRLYATLLATSPLILLIGAAHAAGEAVGYLFGPGSSPNRLH